MRNVLILVFSALCSLAIAQPTPKVIDKIVAVVGSDIILLSGVEQQYLFSTQQEGGQKGPEAKCDILEGLMFQKLLINQARLDSIEISDGEVEVEMDKRINYFMSYFGDVAKLEEFYGKPLTEIKEDLRTQIKDQQLAGKVQSKLTADIKVAPNDIYRYYNNIPKDSLPLVNSEVEIGQIVKKPVISAAEKDRVKTFLRDLRTQINSDPTLFAAKALIYSEDPGSRIKGGELGFVGRDQLVPEFAAAAFSLTGKNVSEVVETEYGYHIIQLIERRGDMINVRHILITPRVTEADLKLAERILDSLRIEIESNRITFKRAAELYSDDTNSKNNGGLLPNPATNSTKFDLKDLSMVDETVFFTVDKLKEGEVSKPVILKKADNVIGYRLVLLKSRTKPHQLNLTDDYEKVKTLAETDKKAKAIRKWIDEKRTKTYIKIDDEYKNCNFQNNWFN